MEMTAKAGLTEDQYQKIITFLDELRSKHMHKMYVSIGGSILLTIPGLITLSSLQYSDKLNMEQHAGNLFSDAAFILWLICLGATLVLFLTGYQKYFGSRALVNRFKRQEFSCTFVKVGQMSGSEGRPPYLMKDTAGTDYYVPLYLDFKQMKPGETAVGIFMTGGGERFAVSIPSSDY